MCTKCVVFETPEQEHSIILDVLTSQHFTQQDNQRINCVPVAFLQLQVILEQKLLVVGQLDNQWAVEGILQPLGEVERNQVTQMQGFAGRAATSVQIELLALLVHIKDSIQISVGKEDSTAQKAMHFLACNALHACQ